MITYCVAVADGTRARFFTLEEASGGLLETTDLLNLDHQAKDAELYSTTKTGQRRRSDGHPDSNDDHRSAHDAELERRFGKRIGEQAAKLTHDRHLARVLVVTSVGMKALIEEALEGLPKQGIQVDYLNKDLTKLSALEIQAHLAKDGLLPALERRHHSN